MSKSSWLPSSIQVQTAVLAAFTTFLGACGTLAAAHKSTADVSAPTTTPLVPSETRCHRVVHHAVKVVRDSFVSALDVCPMDAATRVTVSETLDKSFRESFTPFVDAEMDRCVAGVGEKVLRCVEAADSLVALSRCAWSPEIFATFRKQVSELKLSCTKREVAHQFVKFVEGYAGAVCACKEKQCAYAHVANFTKKVDTFPDDMVGEEGDSKRVKDAFAQAEGCKAGLADPPAAHGVER